MRLFLVRRTRQFIIKHYAQFDAEKGRYYVWLNGQPQYFPLTTAQALGTSPSTSQTPTTSTPGSFVRRS
jgi:hypothetical protein